MQRHGGRTVEFSSQFLHGMVVLTVDQDGVFEEVTMHHRADGEVTDDHRRDGQQYQGQPDHSG